MTPVTVTPLDAALLGLVEGLTEYLPVSSTGHLILTSRLLGLGESPAVKSFEIVIQAGAILAVLGLYRQRVRQMAAGLFGRDPAGRRLLINLVVACLPAAVIGLLLKDLIKGYLFHPTPVAAALGLGGLAMLFTGGLQRRRADSGRDLDQLSTGQALLIGLAQCLAMWPGTSRSLATILAGLGIGLTPVAAAEFSFLLALPTLGGATFLDLLTDGRTLIEGVGPLALAIGLAVAFLSAAAAVKGFVAWLTRHSLAPFGYYRLLLAGVVWFFWVR